MDELLFCYCLHESNKIIHVNFQESCHGLTVYICSNNSNLVSSGKHSDSSGCGFSDPSWSNISCTTSMVVIHTSPFVNKWARQFKLGHFCWHMAICSNSAMSLPLTQLATKILSFVFHLAKITGPCLFFVPATVITHCQRTFPICSIALWSDRGIVSALTLGIHIPHSCNWKDKAKMAQNSLLLCGTVASENIFKLDAACLRCPPIRWSQLCLVSLFPLLLCARILLPLTI